MINVRQKEDEAEQLPEQNDQKGAEKIREFVREIQIRHFDGYVMKPLLKYRNVTDQIMEVNTWLPSERVAEKKFAAFPMHVSQQCIISVLEANRKTTADEILTILYKKNKAKELVKKAAVEWKQGDACFARFSEDRSFYRATVCRVNFARNSCMVSSSFYGKCKFHYY